MNLYEKNIKNLEKCFHFDSCSQNFCPLDLRLRSRSGGDRDKCRWMREPSVKKIKGKQFISGGRVIPSAVLNFVPKRNLKWLNKASQISLNKCPKKSEK